MAGAKKNVASVPTKPNATVIGRLRANEEVQALWRVLACPGCGAKWVVEPDEDVKPTEGAGTPTLHFPFKCSDCKYAAAMGLT